MSITQINPEFSNIRPKSRSWLTWILRNFMSSRQYNNTRGLDALQIKLHKSETEARPRQKLFVRQWHHSAPIYKYNIATLLIILQPYFTSRPVNSDQRACFCGSFCNFWQSQQLQSHHSHLNHHHFLCLFVGRINLNLFLFFFTFFFLNDNKRKN